MIDKFKRYEIQYKDGTGRDFGVFLYDYPEISSAKHNYLSYSVPGMDGELIGDEDCLGNITIRCQFSVLSNQLMPSVRRLKQWLSGTGRLSFSDTADCFFEVLKIEHGSIERELREYGRFTVIFICYPYEFTLDGQNPFTSIKYNGYDTCMPLYKITGQGECVLTVNGKAMKATVYDNLTIDTRLFIAFQSGGTIRNTYVSGKYRFMWLPHGDCDISVSSGFELEITPRWGYKV